MIQINTGVNHLLHLAGLYKEGKVAGAVFAAEEGKEPNWKGANSEDSDLLQIVSELFQACGTWVCLASCIGPPTTTP